MTKLIRQYVATFTALLFITTSGMHYAWPSPSLPILLNDARITSDEGSWLAIIQLIGAPIGCLGTTFWANVVGRKYLILSTSLPLFLSWIMIAYVESVSLLYAARFLAGLGDGLAFATIPLYVGEIADPKIRGLLGSSMSAAWILGMLLINLIGSYLSISGAALVSSVFPVIALMTFIGMPESPYFLILAGRYDLARNCLEKLTGTEDVDCELERLKEAVTAQNRNSGKCLDLFTNIGNKRALFIMMILRNGQQMSGAAAISFYTQTIFREAGDFLRPEVATLIFVSVQLIMAMICSACIDKTGRRVLLIVSLAGSALTLIIKGTYFYLKTSTTIDTSSFNFVPMISLIGYVIFFNVGMQPIPLLMVGELFPTNVKAFAASLTEIYFCLVASLMSKLFQIVNDSYGMYLSFYIFGTCCVVNLIIIAMYVPETKGKTLEEIQDHLVVKKLGRR